MGMRIRWVVIAGVLAAGLAFPGWGGEQQTGEGPIVYGIGAVTCSEWLKYSKSDRLQATGFYAGAWVSGAAVMSDKRLAKMEPDDMVGFVEEFCEAFPTHNVAHALSKLVDWLGR